MPLLKMLAMDIKITNPHVKSLKVHLNSFLHKGYWYHGKNREHETMHKFSELILPGNTIIEVGGHIGYITQYFSQLAGKSGKVYVFEPGSNNIPYIRKNVSELANTQLVEKGVSNNNGEAIFYEDSLTGQNNSLESDYHILVENKKISFVETEVSEKLIKLITLDDFCGSKIIPNFIKIDVEGLELNVLQGMTLLLKPAMMIEVTKNHKEIGSLLKEAGYDLFDVLGKPILDISAYEGNNLFCLPSKNLN